MSTPKFRNADGTLTAYALACGYLDSRMTGVAVDYYGTDADGVTLYAEGDAYHVLVRAEGVTYEGGLPRRVNGVRADWYSFDTLREARRFWRKAYAAVRRGDVTLRELRDLSGELTR